MQPSKTKHDVSRLPKWAQEMIGGQELEIESLNRRLRDALGERAPSQCFQALSHYPYEQRLYLDPGRGVVFTMEKSGRLDAEVSFCLRKQGDEQFIEVRGGRGLLIRPWSGNMVRITPERF
jgi:hypothetical protein